ncbi:hypothetical protein F5882DRAFT_470057 [Hyaloscypha sp. PMI_1271]|nr:hypothetical protein F5882DRAFT_470057 [Hyaloscypha sp. PMI_1271]
MVQKFVQKERSLAVTQVKIALATFSVLAVVIYVLNCNVTREVVRAPQEQWSTLKALGMIHMKYNLGYSIPND